MTADTCVTVSSGTRRKVDRASLHGFDPVIGDGVCQHSSHGPGGWIARQVLVPPTGPGCRPPRSKHGPAPGTPFRSEDGAARPAPVR